MARLNDEEVEAALRSLEGWTRDDETISKRFKRADFLGSVELVNMIAPVAEEMNRHPDLAISSDTVTVSLTPRSEGGLTRSDFELAARIDALG